MRLLGFLCVVLTAGLAWANPLNHSLVVFEPDLPPTVISHFPEQFDVTFHELQNQGNVDSAPIRISAIAASQGITFGSSVVHCTSATNACHPGGTPTCNTLGTIELSKATSLMNPLRPEGYLQPNGGLPHNSAIGQFTLPIPIDPVDRFRSWPVRGHTRNLWLQIEQEGHSILPPARLKHAIIKTNATVDFPWQIRVWVDGKGTVGFSPELTTAEECKIVGRLPCDMQLCYMPQTASDITLTATPDAGFVFDRWVSKLSDVTIPCEDIYSPSCTVTRGDHVELVATFKANP